MDNQNWYYTLSAISQVCAALAAIGGAVVVFKLSNIEKELNDFRGRVVKAILVPITGRTETQFYYFNDDEIVHEYKNNKNKIIEKSGEVNREIVTAIRDNYKLKGRSEFWVWGTISSFLSVLNARVNSLSYFRQMLFLLITSIILNVVILAIVDPNINGVNFLYYFSVFYSVTSIFISSILSYKILTIKMFDSAGLSSKQRRIYS